MKRTLAVLLVLVGCMCLAIPAQAQLQWGVKGGVNLAKLDYKDIKDNSTGFFIGRHIHCRGSRLLLQL